jgi:prevent-host-death family protein
MRSMTATQASRNFAALLDVVEQGESVLVTRDGVPIGRFTPEHRSIGEQLHEVMSRYPVDSGFADDIEAAMRDLRAQPGRVDEWPTD